MLIILNISYSLCQVAVGADPRSIETVLDLAQELFNHWNPIFTDHNTFHFIWFHLTVPFVSSNITNSKSFHWIGI
jgi:hypothetical protein